jgi:hypothetical protein
MRRRFDQMAFGLDFASDDIGVERKTFARHHFGPEKPCYFIAIATSRMKSGKDVLAISLSAHDPIRTSPRSESLI